MPTKPREFTIPILGTYIESINRHGEVALGRGLASPTAEDLQEVLLILIGLCRSVEVNIRAAYDEYIIHTCSKEIGSRREILEERLIKECRSAEYKEILSKCKTVVYNTKGYDIFKNTALIANGLAHGNFYEAYIHTEKAYLLKLPFEQPGFLTNKLISTSFGKRGLIIDALTGEATDQDGNVVEAIMHKPSKSKTIDENLFEYYRTGAFYFTFDVLLLSYKNSLILRYETKDSYNT